MNNWQLWVLTFVVIIVGAWVLYRLVEWRIERVMIQNCERIFKFTPVGPLSAANIATIEQEIEHRREALYQLLVDPQAGYQADYDIEVKTRTFATPTGKAWLRFQNAVQLAERLALLFGENPAELIRRFREIAYAEKELPLSASL